MRRLDRPRRAGGSGRNRQSLEVERDDQSLALDAVEIDIRSIRYPWRTGAVHGGRLHFAQNRALQAIAQRQHLFGFAVFESLYGQFRSLAQPNNSGDILCPRAPRSLVISAEKSRLKSCSFADIK